MSPAVIIVISLSLLMNMPVLKELSVGNYKVKNISYSIYFLLIAIISEIGLFTGISDSLLVALSFVYIVSHDDERAIVEYLYNSIILSLVTIALFFNIEIVWISFALLALIFFNYKRNNSLYTVLGLAFSIAPGFSLIQSLYVQWGGLLIIPTLNGIISSRLARDRFIFSSLIVLIISSTRFYSLGYTTVIIIGLGLILLFVKGLNNKKDFIYTMSLIPFVGIYNPVNIIGIYISINVILLYKKKLLKIVNDLEIKDGTIKNIRYQDMIIFILGLYILAGAPGSPMSWLVQVSLKQKYLIYFLLILDIFEINKIIVSGASAKTSEKNYLKGVREVTSILYVLIMCIVFRASIYKFNYVSLIFIGIFILLMTLYKKKKKCLFYILDMREVLSVTSQRPYESHLIKNQTLKLRQKIDLPILTFAGFTEVSIWSFFIFIVSILLIWRYV